MQPSVYRDLVFLDCWVVIEVILLPGNFELAVFPVLDLARRHHRDVGHGDDYWWPVLYATVVGTLNSEHVLYAHISGHSKAVVRIRSGASGPFLLAHLHHEVGVCIFCLAVLISNSQTVL